MIKSTATAYPILEFEDVSKSYSSSHGDVSVIEGASFTLHRGEQVAIVGPSGSGKTTLLGLCAGLDAPTSGAIRLAGEEIQSLSEDQRSLLRGEKVGFVFQNFQLLPTLTALENVMAPLELRGGNGARERALPLLKSVGLQDRIDHYPIQLSGGEQQRVAIARAFVNDPAILFADEPTGNLDEDTSEGIVELLLGLKGQTGATLVLVTHDLDLASRAERHFRIVGGKVLETSD